MWWRRRSEQTAADPAPDTVDTTIEFVGYATDSVVSGEVTLDSHRLSDLLSSRDEYEVHGVSLEVLADDRVLHFDTTTVHREELCLVAGTGPRGDPSQRVRTRPYPVRARVGPYEVFGHLHASPTTDPIAVTRRRVIIPLTRGWVRYARGDEIVERRHEVMLLNGRHVSSLDHSSDEDMH